MSTHKEFGYRSPHIVERGSHTNSEYPHNNRLVDDFRIFTQCWVQRLNDPITNTSTCILKYVSRVKASLLTRAGEAEVGWRSSCDRAFGLLVFVQGRRVRSVAVNVRPFSRVKLHHKHLAPEHQRGELQENANIRKYTTVYN